jgi:hypothetical protein
MLRKMLCGVFVLAVTGMVFAEEFTGMITKVDGDKVTVQKTKKGKAEGDPVTMTVSKDCKVVKGKLNKETKKVEAGESLEGGLKNALFTTIGEKGIPARITAEGTTVSEIIVMGGKKKKE